MISHGDTEITYNLKTLCLLCLSIKRENYVITERMKANEYTSQVVNSYFWRTYDRKEIDLVEEKQSKLDGYEIKWQPKKIKIPSDWKNNYTNASFDVINQKNYLNFIQHSL